MNFLRCINRSIINVWKNVKKIVQVLSSPFKCQMKKYKIWNTGAYLLSWSKSMAKVSDFLVSFEVSIEIFNSIRFFRTKKGVPCVVCSANTNDKKNLECFNGDGEVTRFTGGVCTYFYTSRSNNGQKYYSIDRNWSQHRDANIKYPYTQWSGQSELRIV